MILLHAVLLAANWPSYRGPGATGVAEGPAPASWNLDAGSGATRGLKWKTPIPGLGHSSPVLWGDRLFVTTAIRADGEAPLRIGLYGDGDSADDNSEQSWVVYCLDKNSGKVLWTHTAHRSKPRAARHPKATHANTSLATDGKNLVAFFGSEGLHVYTLDGKLRWKKDLGVLDMAPFADRSLSWGFASSPVLHEGVVVVQADSKANGFAAALSVDDGRELWRVRRDPVSVGSWGTPGVITAGGRKQVVLNGYPFIASYDFSTGKELWRLRAEGDVPVPVPFEAGGLIYVANAHGGKSPLYAIRPDAAGDISLAGQARTSAGVVWSQERNGSYLQTPVVYRGIAYACTSNGVFKAYDAATGAKLWEQRLGDGSTGFTSSPIAADGRVYVTSEEGETYVLRHGRTFEQLAKNTLGEIVLSTPAVADGVMYFRTRGHVVAIR